MKPFAPFLLILLNAFSSAQKKAILSKPQDKKLSNVVFGGPNRNTLYVTSSDKFYKRTIDAIGAVAWEATLEPFRGKL
jgi:hypothetical protein